MKYSLQLLLLLLLRLLRLMLRKMAEIHPCLDAWGLSNVVYCRNKTRIHNFTLLFCKEQRCRIVAFCCHTAKAAP